SPPPQLCGQTGNPNRTFCGNRPKPQGTLCPAFNYCPATPGADVSCHHGECPGPDPNASLQSQPLTSCQQVNESSTCLCHAKASACDKDVYCTGADPECPARHELEKEKITDIGGVKAKMCVSQATQVSAETPLGPYWPEGGREPVASWGPLYTQ